MRIVIDLQATQGEHAARGIGRYSVQFALALLQERLDNEIVFSISGAAPDAFEPVREALIASDPAVRIVTHGALRSDDLQARMINEAELRAHWTSLRPDVVHVSAPFDRPSLGIALPSLRDGPLPWRMSATLYDLIPALFPQRHLPNAAASAGYARQLSALRRYDLLLAISESTRADALRVLDLPADRVRTIHADAAPVFNDGPVKDTEWQALAARVGLRKEFVLYTGGMDPRKNQDGLIEAFARLPVALRESHQLALVMHVSGDERTAFERRARRAGLSVGTLVVCGHVTDEELRMLYARCALFAFPSLYEGFGLPVLEAMRCGAPAVVSNNSSLIEVQPLAEARFDAEDPEAIARVLGAGLGDAAYRERVREAGRASAGRYAWRDVARSALESWSQFEGRPRQRPSTARRIAVVTPVPPQLSGIASYNQELLPFLCERVEVDVFGFPEFGPLEPMGDLEVQDAGTLPRLQDRYDVVIHHFGNSHYHAGMFDLLDRVPGVVVLHDVYLSGLLQHADMEGDTGALKRAMLASHTLCDATNCTAPRLAGDWVARLPGSGGVVRRAVAVIVHSDFARRLLCKYFGDRSPPVDLVPHLRTVRGRSAAEYEAARRRLSIEPGRLIIASFGHVVWTKMPERLLQAFVQIAGERPDVDLAFVGQLAEHDPLSPAMRRTIREAGLSNRVRITGYTSSEEYRLWLQAADLAVQLRTNTRGETSGAALDCLASGVPLVVNAHGSLAELPLDAVAHLTETAPAAEIADTVSRLLSDADRRKALSLAGISHLKRMHSGHQAADAYLRVVDREVGWCRSRAASARTRFTVRAPTWMAIAATAWDLHRRTIDERRRLLLDVSFIARRDYGTGIQRVVKSIAYALGTRADLGWEVRLVALVDGALRFATEVESALFARPDTRAASGMELVTHRDGDVLLMIDSSWDEYEKFTPVFSRVRARAGMVATVVYDTLPANRPEFFGGPGAPMPKLFSAWLHAALNASDALLCISRSVHDEVVDFAREHRVASRARVTWFHLGSNLPSPAADEAVFEPDLPTFLCVSTVEPRKGQDVLLDACELLWARGKVFRLCLVGQEGWGVEVLARRLRNHPLRGHQLLWVEGASDAQVARCYRDARAFVFPSRGEGFGLGLVEAAHAGLPLICSDLRVFREIAGENALYVPVDDCAKWASAVELALSDRELIPDPSLVARMTWDDSARQLLERLLQPHGTPLHEAADAPSALLRPPAESLYTLTSAPR
jgi:glycosyltransferase involved in cell wall biosynthesis